MTKDTPATSSGGGVSFLQAVDYEGILPVTRAAPRPMIDYTLSADQPAAVVPRQEFLRLFGPRPVKEE